MSLSEYVLQLLSVPDLAIITDFQTPGEFMSLFKEEESIKNDDTDLFLNYQIFTTTEFYNDDNDKTDQMKHPSDSTIVQRPRRFIRKPMIFSDPRINEETTVWVEHWNPKSLEYAKSGIGMFCSSWEKKFAEKDLIRDACTQWYIAKHHNRPDLVQSDCFICQSEQAMESERSWKPSDTPLTPYVYLVTQRDSTEGHQTGMNVTKFVNIYLKNKYHRSLVTLHLHKLIISMFEVVTALHEMGVYQSHRGESSDDIFAVNLNKGDYRVVTRGFRRSRIDRNKMKTEVTPLDDEINRRLVDIRDDNVDDPIKYFRMKDTRTLLNVARDLLEDFEQSDVKKKRKDMQLVLEGEKVYMPTPKYDPLWCKPYPAYLSKCLEKLEHSLKWPEVKDLIPLLEVPDIESAEREEKQRSLVSKLGRAARGTATSLYKRMGWT